jgi:hypothetical protein
VKSNKPKFVLQFVYIKQLPALLQATETNKLESSSYENKDFDETTERIVYRFTLVKITGIRLFDVFHLNFRVFEAINKNTKVVKVVLRIYLNLFTFV